MARDSIRRAILDPDLSGGGCGISALDSGFHRNDDYSYGKEPNPTATRGCASVDLKQTRAAGR